MKPKGARSVQKKEFKHALFVHYFFFLELWCRMLTFICHFTEILSWLSYTYKHFFYNRTYISSNWSNYQTMYFCIIEENAPSFQVSTLFVLFRNTKMLHLAVGSWHLAPGTSCTSCVKLASLTISNVWTLTAHDKLLLNYVRSFLNKSLLIKFIYVGC